MLPTQGSIQFSGYTGLYDIIVPQDHELRKLNELCGVYVCPAGHMAIRKGVSKDEKKETYYFDVKRCVVCKQREGCFKFNQKSETYCVCHRTEEQERQMDFQETDEFREKYRTRYKIEAKNSDLKNKIVYQKVCPSR